jgi:hypothetical protein
LLWALFASEWSLKRRLFLTREGRGLEAIASLLSAEPLLNQLVPLTSARFLKGMGKVEIPTDGTGYCRE